MNKINEITEFKSLYAYFDESGNTGLNLKDEVQPIFYECAMVSSKNVDNDNEFEELNDIVSKMGVKRLHGAELGINHIENIIAYIDQTYFSHILKVVFV